MNKQYYLSFLHLHKTVCNQNQNKYPGYRGPCHLCRCFHNTIAALFVITVLVVLLSKIIIKFTKGPVLLFFTPILIPFIPGATLYYAMSDLVRKSPETNENLQLLVYQVSALALGILVAELLIVFLNSFRNNKCKKYINSQ